MIARNSTTNETIFATGVFLQAVEVEINGVKQWRWVAVNFEADSYCNGNLINVYTYANSFEELEIKDYME